MLASLKKVFTKLQGAFFVLDGRGTIMAWSAAASTALGYTEADAVGKRCYDLLRGRDLCGNAYCVPECPVLQTCRRGEPTRPHELWLTRKNGSEAQYTCSVCVITSARGAIIVYHLHEGGMLARSWSQGTSSGTSTSSSTPANATRVPSSGPARRLPMSERPAATSAARESLSDLTRRESEILGLLAKGRRASAIAPELSISYATVRNHIQSLLRKLGVHSQLEAVALAHRNGLA